MMQEDAQSIREEIETLKAAGREVRRLRRVNADLLETLEELTGRVEGALALAKEDGRIELADMFGRWLFQSQARAAILKAQAPITSGQG
jgi:hypothetical protein